jgi:DNA-binding MarR family transcriptional regulator
MCIHVDRLVRRGYVLRKRDPRDGRRAQLRLSASGRRVREANSVLDPQRVRRMLDGLDPAARRDALHGLALLAGAADASAQAAARTRKRR